MIKDKKIVFYELNEVPRRVLDDFVLHYPESTLDRLLKRGRLYQTVTEDSGILSPWITWPTLHRGIVNEKHCISDFGQDLTEVNAAYPSFMDLLSRAGLRVGVFGSLHTYPLPDNIDQYAFYVPDTFANGTECFPETLSVFQDFNLKMMDASGRNVSRSLIVGPAVRFLTKAPGLGLRLGTVAKLAGQLVSERVNPARAVRRRISQAQIAFDLFLRQLETHQPDIATCFTNHVASSMHRYWPGKFPKDFNGAEVTDAWMETYAGEIDFAMQEADDQLSMLASFVERNSNYALVIASSMGQAAVDASTIIHHQLYIDDIGRFMHTLGVGDGGWVKNRAMLPRYIFRISDSYVAKFRESVASVTVNGVPIDVSELGGNIFRIKLGQHNLRDDQTIVCFNGIQRPIVDIGLTNVSIQDETGSYAYHIPQGIMLVYDPRESTQHGAKGGEISTCQIAPTILANFGIKRPGYMNPSLIKIAA